ARVLAGRVNVVLVPGAAGQALLKRQLLLVVDEHLVHFGKRGGRESAAIGAGRIESLPVFGGGLRQGIDRIVERRKIQIRRNLLARRSHGSGLLARVGGRAKQALVEFAVAFDRIVAHFVREIFHVRDV